jgi:hypothetical protein
MVRLIRIVASDCCAPWLATALWNAWLRSSVGDLASTSLALAALTSSGRTHGWRGVASSPSAARPASVIAYRFRASGFDSPRSTSKPIRRLAVKLQQPTRRANSSCRMGDFASADKMSRSTPSITTGLGAAASACPAGVKSHLRRAWHRGEQVSPRFSSLPSRVQQQDSPAPINWLSCGERVLCHSSHLTGTTELTARVALTRMLPELAEPLWTH